MLGTFLDTAVALTQHELTQRARQATVQHTGQKSRPIDTIGMPHQYTQTYTNTPRHLSLLRVHGCVRCMGFCAIARMPPSHNATTNANTNSANLCQMPNAVRVRAIVQNNQHMFNSCARRNARNIHTYSQHTRPASGEWSRRIGPCPGCINIHARDRERTLDPHQTSAPPAPSLHICVIARRALVLRVIGALKSFDRACEREEGTHSRNASHTHTHTRRRDLIYFEQIACACKRTCNWEYRICTIRIFLRSRGARNNMGLFANEASNNSY